MTAEVAAACSKVTPSDMATCFPSGHPKRRMASPSWATGASDNLALAHVTQAWLATTLTGLRDGSLLVLSADPRPAQGQRRVDEAETAEAASAPCLPVSRFVFRCSGVSLRFRWRGSPVRKPALSNPAGRKESLHRHRLTTQERGLACRRQVEAKARVMGAATSGIGRSLPVPETKFRDDNGSEPRSHTQNRSRPPLPPLPGTVLMSRSTRGLAEVLT